MSFATRYRVSVPAAIGRSAALLAMLCMTCAVTAAHPAAQASALRELAATESAAKSGVEKTEQPEAAKSEAAATTPLPRPLPPTILSRLPRRPERSDEQRTALAAELRELYRKPSTSWPAPTVDAGVKWQEIGLLPEVEHPAGNPHSAAKVELGKMLFFDPRLSAALCNS